MDEAGRSLARSRLLFGDSVSRRDDSVSYRDDPTYFKVRVMEFSEALRGAIGDNPGVSPYYAGRVLLLLDAPDSIRKRLAVRALENHARAHLEYTGAIEAGALIDWASINWSEVLGVLLKILVAILPLLLL